MTDSGKDDSAYGSELGKSVINHRKMRTAAKASKPSAAVRKEQVKNGPRSSTISGGAVSRRKFIGQAGAAAIGFSIVPRRVLGGAGYVPPSDKVNIAFIGVGSQGLRVMLKFLREPLTDAQVKEFVRIPPR